jgi:hypothetical protein
MPSVPIHRIAHQLIDKNGARSVQLADQVVKPSIGRVAITAMRFEQVAVHGSPVVPGRPIGNRATSSIQHLWVADGVSNTFLKYDLNGKLLYSWGTYGSFPGAFWGVHQFSIDSEGNLHAAETFGGRTQKFRPKKDADPRMLIGQPVIIPSSQN